MLFEARSLPVTLHRSFDIRRKAWREHRWNKPCWNHQVWRTIDSMHFNMPPP